MRSFLTALVVLAVSAGCAKVKPPTFDPASAAEQTRCESKAQKDIVIPVELYSGDRGCLAKVGLAPGTPNPRACRGYGVWWQITNRCAAKAAVQIAFSPFDVNSTRQDVKPFRDPRDYGYIRDRVWVKARGTRAGGPGRCSDSTDEQCGDPYKYDIYVNGVLVLDPELEVEY